MKGVGVSGEQKPGRAAQVLGAQVAVRDLPVQVFSGVKGGLDRLDKLAGGLS